MQHLLDNLVESNKKWVNKGKVASYIPELSKANKDVLGVCLTTLTGEEYCAGDYNTKFTIQSISKVITLMLAILDNGDNYVFSKVGKEPSEASFNSIMSLENNDTQKPLNPMLNSGAIVTTSMITGKTSEEKIKKILNFTRKICKNPNIGINKNVYLSEKNTGDRNRALAYFMKSNKALEGNVEEILNLYFQQCSMEVTCKDISRIGSLLANDGIIFDTGERIIPKKVARIVKTIMVTCGMYDSSGDFAVKVGIPSKSGVGGGILAAVPKQMGIGVIGPSLDKKGNSIAGIKLLEDLSTKLDLSIF